MTRLIDADVLKKKLQDAFEEYDGYDPHDLTRFAERVDDEIDNAPTIEERPQGEWISVYERLPEDMQRVLIWFEYYRYGDFNCMYQTYGFGYVCDGKWSPFINGETGWQDSRIIAWQPLPQPYEEEDNEQSKNGTVGKEESKRE